MKVLLVGVGGVGEAIAMIARERPWVEKLVLADYDRNRVKEVQARLGHPERFPAEFVDASNQKMIEELVQKHKVDLVSLRDGFSLNTASGRLQLDRLNDVFGDWV